MKLFFEICKEFFDMLYLPFVSDIIENEILSNEESNEELDEEKGYKEDDNQDTQDYEYIQNDEQDNRQLIPDIQYNPEKQHDKKDDIEESIEDDKDFCECGCEFFRQTLSIINARIYKFINDNKMEWMKLI